MRTCARRRASPHTAASAWPARSARPTSPSRRAGQNGSCSPTATSPSPTRSCCARWPPLLEDEARSRIDSPPEREARAAVRGVEGGLVAIVDDDEILVALVGRRLERAGFEVVTYAHGGQALRELTERPAAPDVLLLDVDLPGLNGLSVLDGMAAAGALHHTRVILATVHDNEAELARARAAVADVDHLAKPYDLDRLVALVAARSRSDR